MLLRHRIGRDEKEKTEVLFSKEFIDAEHKYRGELLRDQNHAVGIRWKAVAVVVIASIVLAACGAEAKDPASQASPAGVQHQGVRDVAPPWEPNYDLLAEILGPEYAEPPYGPR
jgi:hypothetical protein